MAGERGGQMTVAVVVALAAAAASETIRAEAVGARALMTCTHLP